MTQRCKRSFKAAVFLFSTLVFSTGAVSAEEITLQSYDGNFSITGDLVEFKDGAYTISSPYGPLRVASASVQCFGAACPGNAVASTRGNVTEWNVSLWGQRRAFTEHIEKLSELVSEKTNGDFTLNIYYGGLSPSRENLDGIAAGAFEMAQFCAGYHPEKNPSITVLELPFLGVKSLEQEVAVSRAVYKHPATIADLARWNATLLMPSPQPQNNILGSGFPPTSLAAFENMTIRAVGGVGRAIEALGATAVNLPAPQVKEALINGDVNAVAFAPHAHMAFGTIESGVWWTTNLNPGTSNCPVVVNTAALERLPSQHRIALLSSVDEALQHYVDNYKDVTLAAWGPVLQERGVVQITITEEIVATIDQEVAGPAAAAWIAENTARGLPAQELYDLVTGIIADGS